MPKPTLMPPRRLIVLGSTGSIGVNALDVVDDLNRRGEARFEIVGLAAGSNASLLLAQAQRFQVKNVAVADEQCWPALREISRVYSGSEAALELIEACARQGDIVLGAMVGSAGVPAILAAIERGCDIALANKETLVAAGTLVMPKVRQRNVNLIPVDSEHSAIFQCIEASRHQSIEASRPEGAPDVSSIRRVVITASGGPFRTWSRQRIEHASVEEALNHPTWNMGPKVTIDSATMMNKALEIIEAHWLFGLPPEKIDVIIHPQSIVHSFVEFADSSVLAQLGPPDMRTPIQYALTWPRRSAGISRAMDWSELRRMDFEPLDHERFRAPRLAYRVIQAGGTAGAIFNAANEIAVQSFLQRQISFGRIMELVEEAIRAIPAQPVHTIDQVFEADRAARRYVQGAISGQLTAAGLAPADR